MIKTTINNEYRLRMTGVALVIAAMGAWFVYDGAIGYPNKNKEHAVFVEKLLELREQMEGELPKAAEWLKENGAGERYIEQFAREAGVKLPSIKIEDIKSIQSKIESVHNTEPDTKKAAVEAARHENVLADKLAQAPYDDTALMTQFGFALVFFAFAGLLIGMVVARARVKFTADDDSLARNNERFAYSELTGIDWKEWHDKHIVRFVFGDHKWTLDGWHYAHVDDIVTQVLAKRKDFTMPEKPAKE